MNAEDVFPYQAFRPGQKHLTESVYDACKGGQRLVVEAMSGFGKTAPVLTGSILAAKEREGRILYVCRTKRQVLRVMEELARIQKRTPVKSVYLFSKSDYCLLKNSSSGYRPNEESFKWYCSFNVTNNLCSYFLNVPLVGVRPLVESFTTSAPTHSDLLRESQKLHVCPYEVTRLALAEAMITVTTYHYLLDEPARSIVSANGTYDRSTTSVVIDEAHNIREFVRDAATSALSFYDLDTASKQAEIFHVPHIKLALDEIAKHLRSFLAEHSSWYLDKDKFVAAIKGGHDDVWLSNLAFELSTCSGVAWQSVAIGRNLPASIIKVGTFLKDTLSTMESEEVVIVRSNQEVCLTNTRPSKLFSNCIEGYQSLILLSATVNPPQLFLRSLGLDAHVSVCRIDQASPSPTTQVRTIIDTGVSTRFKSRNPETYSKLVRKLIDICGSVAGGIGIFVPSYSVLESIEPLLSPEVEARRRRLLKESRTMNSLDADEAVNAFKSSPGSILLAVQGGRFSEGEDFPGDQMDASVVVGLSLPPPSPLQYAGYAKSIFSKPESYLVISLLPAIRKAVQSAGRHMRSPEKRGLVFFLDSRFDNEKILDLIPHWLKQDVFKGDFSATELKDLAAEFLSSADQRSVV